MTSRIYTSLSVGALALLILSGCGTVASNEESNTGGEALDVIEYVSSTIPEVIENEEGALNTGDEDIVTGGSCDVIDESSICLEYVGSIWNEEHARLNCSDQGDFSTGHCPRPTIGGCRMGAGKETEVVTWYYNYGGEPMGEALPYASGACNALPDGQWTN